MILKKVTVKLIEKVIEELKQPENMKKIKLEIMDPLIVYSYNKLYPYFYFLLILFLLIFILALLIFLLLLKMLRNHN